MTLARLLPWSLLGLLGLLALAAPALAAEKVVTRTVYDDDRDMFVTTGEVVLDVPFETVTRVAGAFGAYREWALVRINRRPSGKPFITQFHDVRYLPGGAGGRGAFDLVYDVDLVWPFGSEGDIIRFAVEEARPVDGVPGAVQRLAVTLGGDSALIETFELALWATGDATGSTVRFKSETRFVGIVDTFFPMSVYRRNVEWRIGKVIQNLQAHVQTR